MSAVFLFILDYMPGFENAFKSSLNDLQENVAINNCDEVASEIWQEILKNFNALKANYNHEIFNNNIVKEELIKDDIDDTSLGFDMQNENTTNIIDLLEKGDIRANYLVAIFETMSNITAQTCGGVLLTPNWVLTAKSCLNVLSHSYPNNTNTSSHYTIIANASNPLSDGSAHNVSGVILHPTIAQYTLALMKISPVLEIEPLKLFNGYNIGLNVIVYGWSIYQNLTDTMAVTRFTAKVKQTNECNSKINFKNSSIFCLRKPDQFITPINSGGPVFVINSNQIYLLGLALIDSRDSYVISIRDSIQWIHSIINDNGE